MQTILGLFRAGEGGTLFLDEVTEMSAKTQSKLPRAIRERTLRPLGSTREIPVNVRLIASTKHDPEEAVRASDLRSDYYRMQANVLQVPPLRERREDIGRGNGGDRRLDHCYHPEPVSVAPFYPGLSQLDRARQQRPQRKLASSGNSRDSFNWVFRKEYSVNGFTI